MQGNEILNKLSILSEAEEGYKLCPSTGKWYPGNGIINALYRTVSGESRKDILTLMDDIIKYINDNDRELDMLTKGSILVAIGHSQLGCEKIIKTYQDDAVFVQELQDRIVKLRGFKDEKPIVKTGPMILNDGVHGNKAIMQGVNRVLNNPRAGSEYLNRLEKK